MLKANPEPALAESVREALARLGAPEREAGTESPAPEAAPGPPATPTPSAAMGADDQTAQSPLQGPLKWVVLGIVGVLLAGAVVALARRKAKSAESLSEDHQPGSSPGGSRTSQEGLSKAADFEELIRCPGCKGLFDEKTTQQICELGNLDLPDGVMRCPKCDTAVSSDNLERLPVRSHCPFCGAELDEQTKQLYTGLERMGVNATGKNCPSCGKVITTSDYADATVGAASPSTPAPAPSPTPPPTDGPDCSRCPRCGTTFSSEGREVVENALALREMGVNVDELKIQCPGCAAALTVDEFEGGTSTPLPQATTRTAITPDGQSFTMQGHSQPDDKERGIYTAPVALRWNEGRLDASALRERAAAAVSQVDAKYDKEVMDVKIMEVNDDQQYVQLLVRANFESQDEVAQMTADLKEKFGGT